MSSPNPPDQFDNGPVYMSAEDMFTDRQLSSELDTVLRLNVLSNEAAVKEETQSSCRFAGHDQAALGSSMSGTYHQMMSYRQDFSSLSTSDLEVDNASLMVPPCAIIPQPTTIPKPRLLSEYKQDFQNQRFDSAEIEKQMKLEDEGTCISGGSMMKHEQWRSQYQTQTQNQVHCEELKPALANYEEQVGETGMHAGEYSVQLDEIGEGPLHLLSVVTDRASLAQSLNVLLECGVVMSLINLQNKYRQTPLFLAVQELNLALVIWLLDNGADPNIQGTLYIDRDEYIWRSPLHLAVMKGDDALPIVRALLTRSPTLDINLLSFGDKLSALHLALRSHNLLTSNFSCRKIILELIDKQADINIRDQSSSKTPCMMVVETRDLPLIQEFLEKFPADKRRRMLQDQTRGGDTCLHLAAGLSRIESSQKVMLLRLLVTNGANGNIANNVKEFPKDFARYEWNQLRRT